MATINIDNFGGIAPRIHSTLLGENMATVAHNCLLKSGKLVPLRKPAPVPAPTPESISGMEISLENDLAAIEDANTLYFWNHGATSTLLAWPGVVSVASSNMARDKYHRIFVSGETGIGGTDEAGKPLNHPCVYIWNSKFDVFTNRSNYIVRHDIVKAMLAAPEASRASSDPIDESKTTYYVHFVQSWIDEYGYESQASLKSEGIEINDGDEVVFSGMTTAPDGAGARRIYVDVPGSTEENNGFRFLFEQGVNTGGGFAEKAVAVDLVNAGETLPDLQSAHGDLEMVTKVPGNFFAGVERGNLHEVRFSEVANFSTWHDSCVATVSDDVVALASAMNTVFALTRGAPWAITGTAPDAMTPSCLATFAPCVSPRSVCSYNGAVFYATTTGVAMLQDSATTAAVVTESMIGPREWEKLHAESSFAAVCGSAIYFWFPDSKLPYRSIPGTMKTMILNMKDDSSIAISTHGVAAKCAVGIGDTMAVVGKESE